MINKIVELKRDLTILNQSSAESCGYWKLEMDFYYKIELWWHWHFLEHKSFVYGLNDMDLQIGWDVYFYGLGVDMEFLWCDFLLSCVAISWFTLGTDDVELVIESSLEILIIWIDLSSFSVVILIGLIFVLFSLTWTIMSDDFDISFMMSSSNLFFNDFLSFLSS